MLVCLLNLTLYLNKHNSDAKVYKNEVAEALFTLIINQITYKIHLISTAYSKQNVGKFYNEVGKKSTK